MLEGYRKEAWAHTSILVCQVANIFAKSPVKPEDCNPTMMKMPGIAASEVNNIKNIWMSEASRGTGTN